MNLKCSNCGGVLTYDAASRLMYCKFCGSFEEVNSQNISFQKEAAKSVEFDNYEDNLNTEESMEEMMECNIYHCSSCGSEIMVSTHEVSSFCAYCGQPTIIFDRVESSLKPKYIIPFSFEKSQAEGAIRERFKKSFFIPSEIKDFKIDKLRGIYIPFWLYDIYYSDNLTIQGKVKRGKRTVTKTFMRGGSVTFRNLTCDASVQLNDELSRRLEPYNTRRLIPFEIGYMSGFYADRFDLSSQELRGVGVERAKSLFDKDMLDSVDASNKKIIHSNPTVAVNKEEYALLPAWFLTFRYKERPYTVLVNGQTGKIVSSLPVSKGKTISFFAIVYSFSFIAVFLITYVVVPRLARYSDDGDWMGAYIIMFSLAFSSLLLGIKKYKKLRKGINLTSSLQTASLVSKRQNNQEE